MELYLYTFDPGRKKITMKISKPDRETPFFYIFDKEHRRVPKANTEVLCIGKYGEKGWLSPSNYDTFSNIVMLSKYDSLNMFKKKLASGLKEISKRVEKEAEDCLGAGFERLPET